MSEISKFTVDSTSLIERTIENSKITKELINDTLNSFTDFLPKLIFALIIFVISYKLINVLTKVLRKILTKRKIDPSVVKFISLLVSISIKMILLISIISYLGIEITSLIAIIGAAGLAIGLALQGTLQNFAGGVIILILKPFKTGDDIEFGGERGIVKEIQLFSTIIEKYGTNENLIIPNSTISSNPVTNWSRYRDRRIDIIFGIGYGSDLKTVKNIIINAVNKDERVTNKIETIIYIKELANSSIDLELRVWGNPTNYFDMRSDMIELIYNTLNENNIEIPFPQLTIHSKKIGIE